MIKTGILGGTFDPFHNGHLHIGKAALETFHLDELWIMPNGRPPHKDSSTITATVSERLEMLEDVIETEERFRLCTYEAERTEVSYSYDTMEHLQMLYPDRRFYFIIGGDSLDMLHKWYHPERLLKCCTILVAVRNEKGFAETQRQIDAAAKEFNADIRLLPVSEFPVSSSEIRGWIQNGIRESELRMYLPGPVLDYIRKHGLYRQNHIERPD